MKKLLLIALTAGSLVTGAAESRADEAARGAKPAAGASDEDDAWLHEHCAYRGLEKQGSAATRGPGTVTTLQHTDNDVTFVKAFVCGERPPFMTQPFDPAPPELVSCHSASSEGLCVPPLSSDPGSTGARSFTTADIEALRRAAEADVADAPAPAPSGTSRAADPPHLFVPVRRRPTTTGETVGWVLVATGAVGLISGGVAGAVALRAKTITGRECDASFTCTDAGLEAAQRGDTAATVATIGIAAGAAVLAGGVVLLTISKPKGDVALSARPTAGGAALSLGGSF
ncbi:MAG: hypothetical protein KC657_31540 [Myxococcales bacterium]|nr:hypothetical protein [Myxococcales bacterium]